MSEIITVSIRSVNDFSCSQETVISSLPFGENEKSRLNSIKNSTHKTESLAALVALNDMVQSFSLNSLTILRTVNNKPYFEQLPLHFSLSHAKKLSVAALGENPVGIDIEALDSNRDITKLVNRFFNEEEKKILQTASDTALTFYSIWTKKEALSKISGDGLSGISNQNSLSCFSYQYFLKFQNETYVMSVCSNQEDDIVINNVYKELTIYEL